MPLIREATFKDCESLGPRLRTADKAEMKALSGNEPVKGLKESLSYSVHRFAIEHDGKPIAIFGGGPHPNEKGWGLPWMMASDDLVTTHRVWLLRNSDHIVDLVQRHYPILWNVIDVRNTVHMRWLEWCGFQFGNVFPQLGAEGRPFQEFWRKRDV